ncbi:MAG TPA: hypothetical protein VK421_00855 [Pyrinomonadaceae bacterium]|nr:hypothetical protein [Pyrinomonadaceae bacterium]
MPMSRYRIVVSAENTPYMAWQCKLFHYSCVTRLKTAPAFVVHEHDADWHDDFRDIVRAGGLVRSAPNYRVTACGWDYAPRNAPGTLMHAEEVCDGEEFIVLCDPDMLFVRRPRFPRTLSGDYYPYMDYDQPAVRRAALAFGVSQKDLDARKGGLSFGVPHVIPRASLRLMAETWMEAVDAFRPELWEISMYAFGLAAIRLGLPVKLTAFNDYNFWPRRALKRDMIHYCYADPLWRKYDYMDAARARQVWVSAPKVPRRSVLGEIVAQLHEAHDFYRRPSL